MELAEYSLTDVINKKVEIYLSIEKMMEMIRQIIDALNYLNKMHKISHRDLKPSNILLNKQKNLMLADFGISKEIKDTLLSRGSLTVAGGTKDYMGP